MLKNIQLSVLEKKSVVHLHRFRRYSASSASPESTIFFFFFFLLPKHRYEVSATYLPEDIEQFQRIFADLLRSECNCRKHFLGLLGPGVTALGGLEHETFFEISPCYFRQEFDSSIFSHWNKHPDQTAKQISTRDGSFVAELKVLLSGQITCKIIQWPWVKHGISKQE